jgi:hypothetical protein
MTAGTWFWAIYVLSILFTGYAWRGPEARPFWGFGLIVFVLIGLLGWHAFGPPLH